MRTDYVVRHKIFLSEHEAEMLLKLLSFIDAEMNAEEQKAYFTGSLMYKENGNNRRQRVLNLLDKIQACKNKF